MNATLGCTPNSNTLLFNAIGGAPPYTYQWSIGQTTAIATGLAANYDGQQFIAVPYAVTVTDSRKSQAVVIVDSLKVLVESNTAIKESNAPGLQAQLIPNPTSGQLTIQLHSRYEQIELALFDLQGRLLLQASYAHREQIDYSLGDQPAGLYLLQITMNSDSGVFKVVKE